MISRHTTGRVDDDGTLIVRVATPLRATDVDLVLTVEPASRGPEADWPPDFFDETYGSFASEPLKRLPQGEPDRREPGG